MAGRTISIRAGTYERLAGLKRRGESFSNLIERLMGARLEASFGILRDDSLDYAVIKKSRADREILD